jgi:hypothetical protein
VNIGDKGTLQPGRAEGIVAIDEAAYNSISNAGASGDTMGIMELMLQQRAFVVSAGTSILIIDYAYGRRKVRILSGQMIGRSGWVPKEWIQ